MRYIYFGKNVRCSVLLPSLICLWLTYQDRETALSALFAVIIHETAHLVSGALLRKKPALITLSPAGADIRYKGVLSYRDDMITALAGPAANVVTAFLFLPLSSAFFTASLCCGLLNLIPLPCLDGGRALLSALRTTVEITRADRINGVVNAVFLVLLYLFSVYLFFYTSTNASLLILCGSIFINSYFRMT